MSQKGEPTAPSGGILSSPRTLGFLSLALASLLFARQAHADAISSAVLDYGGGVWAAYPNPEPYAGIPSPYNAPETFNLSVSNSAEDEIDDPAGNEYLDDSYNGNCTFDLSINVSAGNVVSGSLTETTGDGYWDPTFSVFTPVTPFTIFSSTNLREFGEAPGGGSDPGYYWFAFQNGSNPNDIIGGYIDPGDVKTFEVSVPEPSSMLILGVVTSFLGTRRFRRNAKQRAMQNSL
jgi:hypothetical protein